MKKDFKDKEEEMMAADPIPLVPSNIPGINGPVDPNDPSVPIGPGGLPGGYPGPKIVPNPGFPGFPKFDGVEAEQFPTSLPTNPFRIVPKPFGLEDEPILPPDGGVPYPPDMFRDREPQPGEFDPTNPEHVSPYGDHDGDGQPNYLDPDNPYYFPPGDPGPVDPRPEGGRDINDPKIINDPLPDFLNPSGMPIEGEMSRPPVDPEMMKKLMMMMKSKMGGM